MKLPEIKQTEKMIENHILDFLYWHRQKGFQIWKHEEHGRFDVARGRFMASSSPHHRIGLSDCQGIIRPAGRWFAIEIKTPKEYAYIMKHWDELKRYVGDPGRDKKMRYRLQIEFVEMINEYGGLAFFACSVQMVEEKLKLEGLL